MRSSIMTRLYHVDMGPNDCQESSSEENSESSQVAKPSSKEMVESNERNIPKLPPLPGAENLASDIKSDLFSDRHYTDENNKEPIPKTADHQNKTIQENNQNEEYGKKLEAVKAEMKNRRRYDFRWYHVVIGSHLLPHLK